MSRGLPCLSPFSFRAPRTLRHELLVVFTLTRCVNKNHRETAVQSGLEQHAEASRLS